MSAERDSTSPILKIIVFFAKPGRLEEFIRFEKSEYARFMERGTGPLALRLLKCVFRAPYSPTPRELAVGLAIFPSRAVHDRCMADPDFIAHRTQVESFIETAEIGFYEIEYDSPGFGQVRWPRATARAELDAP